MAKSTVGQTTGSRNQTSSKGTFPYCSTIVALLAVSAVYVYFDRTSTLNKFSVAMTEKLCDMLPNKHEINHENTYEKMPEKSEEKTVKTKKPSKESLHNPKLQSGAVYNSKGKVAEYVASWNIFTS